MVARLVKLGASVSVEAGLGEKAALSDATYQEAGASVVSERASGLKAADVVFRVGKPPAAEIAQQKAGAVHLSFLDPFNESGLIGDFAKARVTAVSLEMMPRSTLAQKMDALSSQASLAGYQAVILAADRLPKIFPMMMTPAGTLSPSRVFIVGVGVAGLQAIATAGKRLGARVEAFDTRPVVETEVKSLGAKFVKIDIGETGQTAQGYAKELTPEQIEKQRQGMAKICSRSDIVITTAKLFGRKAPLIITEEMVAGMSRGSVIVDLAAEGGGNVAGTVLDEEIVTPNGVRIIGHGRLECRVPQHASQMYSSNLTNFVEHFWDEEAKSMKLDLADDILKGCVITHGGAVVHERFKDQ
jgi:NAD(P) transhydrogenase subunit alpha